MRKEVLAAIITGILIGVVVAFGVWRANVAFKPENQSAQSQSSSPTPQPTVIENGGITIAKPEQNQVIAETPVMISGLTKASSWLAISAEEKDYILKAADNGEFEVSVELIGGANQLVTYAFAANGQEYTNNLILVYSTEFKSEVEEPTPTAGTPNEAESVSDKIQEKLKEASKIPTAYLGTITDIAETTVQVRTLAGEIRQISVTSQTSYAKINKGSKNIGLSDVAIGDFIIAMGYKDENEVLETQRLLVTEVVTLSQRKAILGTVVEVKKKELVVQLNDGNQLSLIPSDDLEVTIEEEEKLTNIELEELGVGDIIIAAGVDLKPNLETRRIHITEKAPESTPTSSPTPEE